MPSRFAVQGLSFTFLGFLLSACSAANASAPAATPAAASPASQPAAAQARNEPAASKPAPAEQAPSRQELAEFVAPADDEARDVATIQTLEAAKAQFQAFIDRAGSKAEYADAVQRSRERLEDIQAQIDFLNQGIAERKAQSGAEPSDGN